MRDKIVKPQPKKRDPVEFVCPRANSRGSSTAAESLQKQEVGSSSADTESSCPQHNSPQYAIPRWSAVYHMCSEMEQLLGDSCIGPYTRHLPAQLNGVSEQTDQTGAEIQSRQTQEEFLPTSRSDTAYPSEYHQDPLEVSDAISLLQFGGEQELQCKDTSLEQYLKRFKYDRSLTH